MSDEQLTKVEKLEDIPTTVTQEHVDDIFARSDFQQAIFWEKELAVSYRLPNGFTVPGRAACVEPSNFRMDKGHEIATEKVKDKIWELEGYLLQQRRYEAKQREKNKLQQEESGI